MRFGSLKIQYERMDVTDDRAVEATRATAEPEKGKAAPPAATAAFFMSVYRWWAKKDGGGKAEDA